MLKRLWNSTASLHARFGIIPLPLPVRKVFEEEVSELLEADELLNATTDANVAGLRQHMAQEAADVLVTVCAFLQSRHIAPVEFEEAINAVILKNSLKTNATHHINAAGKIARRKD